MEILIQEFTAPGNRTFLSDLHLMHNHEGCHGAYVAAAELCFCAMPYIKPASFPDAVVALEFQAAIDVQIRYVPFVHESDIRHSDFEQAICLYVANPFDNRSMIRQNIFPG